MPSDHFLACSLGKLLTCSSTTVRACFTAADAVDQTEPHPHALAEGGGDDGAALSAVVVVVRDGAGEALRLVTPSVPLRSDILEDARGVTVRGGNEGVVVLAGSALF